MPQAASVQEPVVGVLIVAFVSCFGGFVGADVHVHLNLTLKLIVQRDLEEDLRTCALRCLQKLHQSERWQMNTWESGWGSDVLVT